MSRPLPTPRTDLREDSAASIAEHAQDALVVRSDFARILERELAVCRAEAMRDAELRLWRCDDGTYDIVQGDEIVRYNVTAEGLLAVGEPHRD